ncbi:hypothetical protein E2C01_020221 [Portunus trituberculatus]|uniref:Uncharacterized protein n=1 Tax=Portunus trituberculatus TaxID=210409 RepID=A0A5B7E1P8_PORTR|nr:hypothetical protein [Portunus trituberculatus]
MGITKLNHSFLAKPIETTAITLSSASYYATGRVECQGYTCHHRRSTGSPEWHRCATYPRATHNNTANTSTGLRATVERRWY